MFYQKYGKRIFDIILALLGLIFFSIPLLFIAFFVKVSSPGPVIFQQKRTGKDGKIFNFYKFRTMVKNAENLKKKYCDLNEANGPVFKIRNDPRFTRVGKTLSYAGLDELPQLVNILKGEMSFVGPRPFPVEEEKQIKEEWQKIRRSIKPGLVSPWATNGAQHDSFKKWMESDLEYIKNCSLKEDLKILYQSMFMMVNLLRKTRSFFCILN